MSLYRRSNFLGKPLLPKKLPGENMRPPNASLKLIYKYKDVQIIWTSFDRKSNCLISKTVVVSSEDQLTSS